MGGGNSRMNENYPTEGLDGFKTIVQMKQFDRLIGMGEHLG